MKNDEMMYINSDDFPTVPLVLDGVSSRFIRENKIIPIEMKNNVLKVILANPDDREIIEALRAASSADIIVYTGDSQTIDEYIAKFYGQGSQNINRIIEDMDQQGFEYVREEEEEDVGHLKDLASEAPIIKLVNLFISRAVESRWRAPRCGVCPEKTSGCCCFKDQDHGKTEHC